MKNIKQVYTRTLLNHFRLNYTESQVNDIWNRIQENMEQLDYDINNDIIQLDTNLMMSWLGMEFKEFNNLVKSSYPYVKWIGKSEGLTLVEVNLTIKNVIRKIN